MQSSLIAFSVALVVLLGLATATDVLPQHRERRAPSDDIEGFEPGTWDEAEDAGMGNEFRTDGIAKRIADNDFAEMRHQERQESIRRSHMIQALNDMLERAGKRSYSEKRSLSQNDYMMLRRDLANGKLYRTLLDRMLSEAGKR